VTSQATLTPTAEKRAATLIYFAAFSFVIMIGSMQVLVPLYGLHLGYDIKALGFIISAQAVLPIFSRLFAGAIADMFGDRWVLAASFAAMATAALVFASSGAFWALIVAQALQGVGRSAYHVVAQSYATRINPDMVATRLGRLSSSGNAGTILSTALAGFLAAGPGYAVAFSTFAAIGVAGVLVAIALPFLPSPLNKRGFRTALAPIPHVAKTRAMGMAAVSAFFGSSTMMLGIVMIIPFMEGTGFSESEVGLSRTVTGVGSLTVGLFFGRIVNRFGLMRLHVVAFSIQGIVLLFFPVLVTEFWTSLPVMFIFGLLFGIIGSLYPTISARFSLPEHRGTAMAYSGQFWGLGQIAVPTGFGFIAAAVGIADAIRIGGITLIVLSVAIIGLYPWLTKRGPPSRGTP
jgi:predicted MFS family arabinose efflux permease